MLNNIQEENILFIDIETVPQYCSYYEMPPAMRSLWDKKAQQLHLKYNNISDTYSRAGIYAEFGKIVCISVGLISYKSDKRTLRLKSFAGESECKILEDFCKLLIKSFNKPQHYLCAHNGKEFDYPYIARRMLINGLVVPAILNIAGQKPWEVRHLDTMELWKFGDYKHFTSLQLLTEVFNISSPKDDIKGEDVAKVYWVEGNIERIVKYCQRDVVAIAQLFLKYKGKEIINENDITYNVAT